MSNAEANFERIAYRYAMRNAVRHWALLAPRKCFYAWKLFCERRWSVRAANINFDAAALRRGLKALRLRGSARRRRRLQWASAIPLYPRRLSLSVFRAWRSAAAAMAAQTRALLEVATRLRLARLLRQAWDGFYTSLKRDVYRIRHLTRAALALYEATLLPKV